MKLFGLLLFTVLSAMTTGCTTSKVASETQPITKHDTITLSPFEAESSSSVALLLRNCPSWLYEDDPRARAFILYRYFEISKRPTVEIRQGVIEFLERLKDSNMSWFAQAEIAKIPLLSRMIFAEPLFLSKEESSDIYFTWISPRIEGGRYKWVALPLGLDEDGFTVISVSRHDYSSPPNVYYFPDAVIKEFDSLSAKFGRSKLEMTAEGRLRRQPSDIPEIVKGQK